MEWRRFDSKADFFENWTIGILAYRGACQEGMFAPMRWAIAHGATTRERLEAIESAAVPGGDPTFGTGVRALMQLDAEGTFKNGQRGTYVCVCLSSGISRSVRSSDVSRRTAAHSRSRDMVMQDALVRRGT
jgi:hypothetical protein